MLILAIAAVFYSSDSSQEREENTTRVSDCLQNSIIAASNDHLTPRSKATKDHEGTEESKYYDTINEGPAYEAVGQGRSKTGGSDVLPSKAGLFSLEECPAYVPTPAGGDRGDTRDESTTALYEQVTPA